MSTDQDPAVKRFFGLARERNDAPSIVIIMEAVALARGQDKERLCRRWFEIWWRKYQEELLETGSSELSRDHVAMQASGAGISYAAKR